MTELTADRALADTPLDRGPVVVTGGASGLGAAVVRAVQAAGGTPSSSTSPLRATGTEAVAVDLADPGPPRRRCGTLAERHGGLGAVVTAAGIDACGRLADVGRRPLGPRGGGEPAGHRRRRAARAARPSRPRAARGHRGQHAGLPGA
jgi:NAD(P)-dependent dehydrogenase (short-subunit alcohol dehydrogenase family)